MTARSFGKSIHQLNAEAAARGEDRDHAGRMGSSIGNALNKAIAGAAGALGSLAPVSPGTSPKRRRFDPTARPHVLCNSYTVGQLEGRLCRPLGVGAGRKQKRSASRYSAAALKAVERIEIRTKGERQKTDKGARNGIIGAVGVDVMRYLHGCIDWVTGQLDPAIETIATAIGYSYSAVHDALKRLRQHGFLHWIRRSRPVKNPDPFGPQVEQTSSAYVLLLPLEIERSIRECLAIKDKEASKSRWQGFLDGIEASMFAVLRWRGDTRRGATFAEIQAELALRESM